MLCYYFILFFYPCSLLYSMSNQQQPYIIYPPPITIYNNTNVDQTSTTSSKQADSWAFIPNAIRTSLSELTLDSLQSRCRNFFLDNKLYLAGLTACSTYGAAYLKTLSARNYLTQAGLWSNWKRELSTQTLLYMSESVLAQDLTFEIQQRYLNSEDPTDFLSPFIQFLKEVKEEAEAIQTCKKLYQWLQYTHLSRILILDMKVFEQLNDQLQRIRYLNHVFNRWMAQQNITSCTAKNE